MRAFWAKVPHQSSVRSTRLLLKTFAETCSTAFPELGGAALEASKVGRTRRSRILGQAARQSCPQAATAVTARDLFPSCAPRLVGEESQAFDNLDAGTFAFAELVKQSGADVANFTAELELQASLNPERDL